MEQDNDHRLSVSMEDLGFNTGCSFKGKLRQKNYDDAYSKVFISKNLETERKRREKLSTRLLVLRSIVPIITSMNKASIIEDAITYTKKLQQEVENLTQELGGMEAITNKNEEQKICESSTAAASVVGRKINKSLIQREIQISKIDGNKLWVKIVIENKRGMFNKLIKNLHDAYIEMIDLSVTTIDGAYLITATLQGIYGQSLDLYDIPTIVKFT